MSLRYGKPPAGPVLVEEVDDPLPVGSYRIRCWYYLHPGGTSYLIPENNDHWIEEFDVVSHYVDSKYRIIPNEHNDQRLVDYLVSRGVKVMESVNATP